MMNHIARSALTVALLQCILSAEPTQEEEQNYAWDCPASGYLPFHRELLVSTDDLARMIESSEVMVLHVGFETSADDQIRRATYSDGHIPGARHLKWSDLKGPLESLESAECRRGTFASLGLSPGRRIVIYDTGLGQEAAAAFVALESVGLADGAAILDGQWVKWVNEGRPLYRWGEEAKPADLEYRPATMALSRTEMQALILQARQPRTSVILLDARAGRGGARRMAAPSPFLRMDWTENLASLSMPVFKGEAGLRQQWASVPPLCEHRVVVAARQWREAAHVYFAARLLGYSVQIFDGSIENLEDPLAPLESGP